jgi:hypothetical protein
VAEDACGLVAGKERTDASERFVCAGKNAVGAWGVVLSQELNALAKALGILLRDREDSMTALSATGTTDEVVAAALNSGG